VAPTSGTGGRLAGKVALVTGAARGQGAAEAELFCREGARVVLADLRDAEGEGRAEALRSAGHEAIFRHLDVSVSGDWGLAIGAAESTFGPLDVLVNNAGVVSFAGLADCSPEEWSEVVAVNQTGVFNGMRAAAPGMRRAGAGSIVNISSIFGISAVPGYFAYQASKAAVVQMTRAAAVELAPVGIRVNCVLPGLIFTPMTETEPEEAVAANIEMTPLGRGGQPEEVAAGVLYLASDEASYVTGVALAIDGGYTVQ
jgi:NAD(P)-dependent dehydrogenase (short-subunit alcohol dehydrogenase family)